MKKAFCLLMGCFLMGCPAADFMEIQEAVQDHIGNEWSIMEFDLVKPSTDGRLIQFVVKVVNVKTGAAKSTYVYWVRKTKRLVFDPHSKESPWVSCPSNGRPTPRNHWGI